MGRSQAEIEGNDERRFKKMRGKIMWVYVMRTLPDDPEKDMIIKGVYSSLESAKFYTFKRNGKGKVRILSANEKNLNVEGLFFAIYTIELQTVNGIIKQTLCLRKEEVVGVNV